MERSGTHALSATPDRVWRVLLDPTAMARCLPGCEGVAGALSPGSDSALEARFAHPVGPIPIRFRGTLRLTEATAPSRLVLEGQVRGGLVHMATGIAEVSLTAEGGGTRLDYRFALRQSPGLNRLSGVIDRLSSALIAGFLAALEREVAAPAKAEGPSAAPTNPVTLPPRRSAPLAGWVGQAWLWLSGDRRVIRAIRPHFDAGFYCAAHPDVVSAGIDPVRHYVRYGAWEGRDPTPEFSTDDYLAAHPDLRAAGVNPFWHHIRQNPKAVPAAPQAAAPSLAPVLAPPSEVAELTPPPLDIPTIPRPEPDAAPLIAPIPEDVMPRGTAPEALFPSFPFCEPMRPRVIDAPIILLDPTDGPAERRALRCRQALALTRGPVLCHSAHPPEAHHPRLTPIAAKGDTARELGAAIAALDAPAVVLWSTAVAPSAPALPLLLATWERAGAQSEPAPFAGAALVGATLLSADTRIAAAGHALCPDGSAAPAGAGAPALSATWYRLRATPLPELRLAVATTATLMAALAQCPAARDWSGLAGPLALAHHALGARLLHQGVAHGTLAPGAAPGLYPGFAAEETLPLLAADAREAAREQILFIDGAHLTPARDAGSVTAVNMLDILQARGAALWFFADAERGFHPQHSPALAWTGIRLAHAPDIPELESLLTHPGLAHAGRLSVVLSRIHAGGRHLELVRRLTPKAKIVFNTVDVHGLRERREALRRGNAADAFRAEATLAREMAVIAGADATIVLSAVEKAELDRTLGYANIALIPMINEGRPGTTPFEARRDILFLGSFRHAPNLDAVTHFLDAIFPLIRAQRPELRFRIVGPDIPETLAGSLPDGAEALGFVPDLGALMDQSLMTVAPLRYGAGIKGKIGTSLAYAVPCVATHAAVEGMALTHGRDVLVGATPEAFAAEAVRLATDGALWQRLSTGGRATFEAEYARGAVAPKLNALFDGLHGAQTAASEAPLSPEVAA